MKIRLDSLFQIKNPQEYLHRRHLIHIITIRLCLHSQIQRLNQLLRRLQLIHTKTRLDSHFQSTQKHQQLLQLIHIKIRLDLLSHKRAHHQRHLKHTRTIIILSSLRLHILQASQPLLYLRRLQLIHMKTRLDSHFQSIQKHQQLLHPIHIKIRLGSRFQRLLNNQQQPRRRSRTKTRLRFGIIHQHFLRQLQQHLQTLIRTRLDLHFLIKKRL
jgi:hypothetical protein